MRIYILTETGKDIGFGHLSRCTALSEAFEERKIMPRVLVNCFGNINSGIIKPLKNGRNQIFNWLKEKSRLLKMISNADLVFIDSYLAGKSLYSRISKMCNGRLVMVDDYNRLEYPSGIVVNPSIYGNNLSYSRKNGSVYLLGKSYIILRKEFWVIPRKKINRVVKNILITFGGGGYPNLVCKITNYLKSIFSFNFYLVEPTKNRIDAKGMLNLMLKADICISAGGQTTYELARVGVPTIGICFAKNQLLNLEEWRKQEFIEYIGWHNNIGLMNNLKRAIEKLSAQKLRLKMSNAGKRLVDGYGTERIVDELLKGFNLV